MVDLAIKVNLKKEKFFPSLTVTHERINGILSCLNADSGIQGFG